MPLGIFLSDSRMSRKARCSSTFGMFGVGEVRTGLMSVGTRCQRVEEASCSTCCYLQPVEMEIN